MLLVMLMMTMVVVVVMMVMLMTIACRSKDCANVPMTSSSEIKALFCPGQW